VRTTSPPPAHRSTTAHLQAAYPFVVGAGLGNQGTYMGRDLHGGAFCFDPWELYAGGLLTSPNLLVVGQIGRGKSTFVKTFAWRQLVFGRRAWIVDPKGEYGPLALACGSAPVRIVPGGSVRLNPLESGGLEQPGSARHRAELLCSIVEAGLGRSLTPAERTAVDLATRLASSRLAAPTLPDLIGALLDPDAELAATVRTDVAGLAADGRTVALELRRLVEGDLAGMFDGPTSPGIDLEAPVVVLDLSALYDSPALGILMTCATAWLQVVLGRRDGIKRLVIVDEAWAILHDLATARWLQAGFKLSRAFGVANVAVVHRLSDLQAAGEAGSAQQRLAEGLLADSETRVIFGQPPSETAAARRLLGLTGTEADLLAHLPRGVALWKVGDRSFLVEHALGRLEAALVDTDEAMRPAPS
jgi:type IV secretory pathway VirB4 component